MRFNVPKVLPEELSSEFNRAMRSVWNPRAAPPGVTLHEVI